MRKIIALVTALCICVGLMVPAFANNDLSNVTIYYPNGDWKYVPVELSVDNGENVYLFALERLTKGKEMPQQCYNEFPKDFKINKFVIQDGVAYVDIDKTSMEKIDEKNYSIDVIKDILSFNIYNINNNINNIEFTVDGKTNDKLRNSKENFFGSKLNTEEEKLIQQKIRSIEEKIRNLTPKQINDLIEKENEERVLLGVSNKVIVIDPGHGGTDPGAVATYNGSDVYEKDLNLAIALATRDALEYHQGYTVLMTRTTDTTVSLSARYLLANNNNATSFISVHCNSSTNTSVKGTTCVYPNNHDISMSEQLALIIHDEVVSSTSFVSHTTPYQDVRNLAVLRNTTMPATITETGFMSNSSDLAYLVNSSNQTTIGNCIGYGTWYWCEMFT